MAYATFSNVGQVISLAYSCALGTRPGVWTIRAVPQSSAIVPLGTLYWVDDYLRSVTLTNCLAVRTELVFGVGGPELEISGEDRRGAWQNKMIDGAYNVRRADGTIIPETERTPQELAALLWAAMGEPGDVSNLPNDDRPEVFWQCADAAAELDRLCAMYGCVPGLQPAYDVAGIFELGAGAGLPDSADMRWHQGFTSGLLPQRIEACGGLAVWQSKFRMRAILPDTDGEWKPADDVSYAPSGGWDGHVADPNNPLAPDDPNWSEQNAERAKNLWKAWQTETFADGTLDVPGFGTVPDRWYLLPILPHLLEDDAPTYGDSGQDAYLIGTGRPLHDPDEPVANEGPGVLFDVSFSIDRQLGIVKSSVPLVKLDDDKQASAAEVYLVCAHRVRSASTCSFARYVRYQTFGGFGVQSVRRQDVTATVRTTYGTGADHTTATGIVDNLTEVNWVLDQAIASKLADVGPKAAAVREYNGVQLIPLTGVVRSVGWMLDSRLHSDGSGNRNVVTRASANAESGRVVYENMRARMAQSDADQAERLEAQRFKRRLIREGAA